MIEIDGTQGEGGGQVLRTALSLSLATGRPFRIAGVRARRERPGLLRQHLTALRAAQAAGAARVSGDALGSRTVTFAPNGLRPGEHAFAVGTAGSTTLVLQAVVPALLAAGSPSRLRVEGGTHNAAAPPWEFFARALLPRLERMGPRVAGSLESHGFYPAGGGRLEVVVEPAPALSQLTLPARGAVKAVRATALVSMLPERIGRTECDALVASLGLPDVATHVANVPDPAGPGNALVVDVETEAGHEVFTGFGRRGVRSEDVAAEVAAEVREYLDADVPVGRHLADQLLVPMALAGGGTFRTLEPSAHARTVAAIVPEFLEVQVRFQHEGGAAWRCEVGPRALA